MKEETVLEILKKAILLEKRGEAFYGAVAEKTEHGAVKRFFVQMAKEETRHAKILEKQFLEFKKAGKFAPENLESMQEDRFDDKVLTKEIMEGISGAGFEAGAITAAISMEDAAIKLYSERAETAGDPSEKAIYEWLAEWEKTHLNILMELNEALTEKIWFDNQFWPY